MTPLTTPGRPSVRAPIHAVARWTASAVSAACVTVHVAVLLRGPSVLTALMAVLAALCVLCLAPGRRTRTPAAGAWGGAMAMSAAMMLLHIGSSGGIAGHAHDLPSAAVPLDGLHGAALMLNGVELVLVMGAVAAIGLRRRILSAAGERETVNID